MGLFGLGRKRGIIDLGERYRRQKEKEEIAAESSENVQGSSGSAFDFLGGLASGSKQESSQSEVMDVSSGEDRKKRLAKRLVEMTNRLEDLSNQIYHLQQRIEVLERKAS